MGPALSRAVLERVGAGELPETVRLSRPGRVVPFGRRDVTAPGYPRAVSAARAAGYEAMERISGGRAALYFEGALSLTRTVADPEPARRTRARFEEMCELLCGALAGFGIDARVGEVPGEYCPGAYSINAGGRVKLAGVGQRIVKGAAHVGVVVVAERSDEVRRVLVPVYRALELAWDPATAGSVAEEAERAAGEPGRWADPDDSGDQAGGPGPGDRGDETGGPGTDSRDAAEIGERGPGVGLDEVEDALLAALSRRIDLAERPLDDETRCRAAAIASRHRSPEA